ncbi:MAG: exodeoxyribonuclease VII small subunit [Acidimicrobiales bacterium]
MRPSNPTMAGNTADEQSNGDPTGSEATSYGDALVELEDLLDELEGADIDVDRLAERVARGAELVRFCRARLDEVTEDVDAVVAELIPAEDGNQDTDDESEAAANDRDTADTDTDTEYGEAILGAVEDDR